MADSPGARILKSWIELEAALRGALPVCSMAPPTQPSELLAALRINHSIGPDEEALVRSLREIRNRVAHSGQEPPGSEAATFEEAVEGLKIRLRQGAPETC